MPIKIQLAIREGWKAQKNERFGEAFEVRFINVVDGKILFRYAPKCEDEKIWIDVFKLLNEYDGTIKNLRGIVQSIEQRSYQLSNESEINDSK